MRDALDTLNVPSDLPHEGMELTTFKEPVICLECNLYLEGLITQGYKCGICEKAFHRKCRASKKDCIPMGLNNNNASTSAPHRSRPEMQHVFLPNDGKSLIKSPSEHEYVNIHTCPGFIGQAVKEKAEEYLCNTKEGTFLVRENIDTRDPGYRISFKYKDSVRHIKIVSVAVNERQVKYCFNKNAGKRFDTLPQLIEYYRTYPLSESFDNLSITLEIPFHAPEMMRAIQSWEATTDSELSFCRDQEVMILEKPPGNWWVGKLGDKVGHVPSTYFVSAH
ncbi:unnamed protein product [Cyprideis torosa]|uniref:Uncharacterized protein n=1 Tax=Cyprideis torosa TaxID=163714 RepID=A0A7R8WT40_9CRUS|nr:unnamed protein product [Cyprideis torosa]CAG0908679.1 unnamed protein product [Cyprideis torosa]